VPDVDAASEYFDGRALRADHMSADDAFDEF